MTRPHHTRTFLGIGASLLLGLTACGGGSPGDQIAEQAIENALEDSGVEIEDLGQGIPADFPAEVPLPSDGVELDSAIKAAGIFTLRYSLSDPTAVVDAYGSDLAAAGFTVSDQFNNLAATGAVASEGRNVGFTASGNGWAVVAVAFGPPTDEAPDGNYLGLLVQPTP